MLLSVAGVVLVLSRGSWEQLLALRLVPGDLYMVAATISWSFYSWLLVRTSEPRELRGDWAAFLMAQMIFGLGWSGAFAGVEWSLGATQITWGWPLAAGLAFIAVGPAILAYRFWGVAAQRAGPVVGGVFHQPHTAVRGSAVHGLPRRSAAPVPRPGVRADRGWHRGVVAQGLGRPAHRRQCAAVGCACGASP